MDEIKKMISELGQDEFVELKEYVDELYRSAKDEIDRKRALQLAKQVSLGDTLVFVSQGKELEGEVIQMSLDKVQLKVEGRERATGLSWDKVIRIK